MKQYIMTIKFQVEDPENSQNLAKLMRDIEEHKAEETMTFGDIITTNITLVEYES